MLSVRDIFKRIAALENAGLPNGTYDIRTFAPVTYESGYQVTFCQVGDSYSDTEFALHISRFLVETDDYRISAGVYGNAEISFNVPDKDTAIALAHAYNQISIWDWANGREILTGGTGSRN